MAQTIKLKRGTSTPTVSDIVSGEVAIDTSAQKLYINDSGQIKEIGGVVPRVCKTFLTLNSTVNNSTTWTQINVFNTTPEINDSGFTVASTGITVPVAGIYCCSVQAVFTANSARTNVGVSFAINGTKQLEASLGNYIRAATGHNEASTSFTTLYNLSASDEIRLQFRQFAGNGTVTLTTESHVAIYKVA